eukprot:6166533-Prymnesium_polylepis.1
MSLGCGYPVMLMRSHNVFIWTTSCRKRLGNGHVALTVLTDMFLAEKHADMLFFNYLRRRAGKRWAVATWLLS